MNQTLVVNLPNFNLNSPQSNSAGARPNLIDTPETERAARLKQLLLDLSKDEDYKDFSSIIRAAADKVREKAFGYNRAVTKKKILKLLSEFYNLEIDDIRDETGISEKEIRAALQDLVGEDKIQVDRRRRWQEVGKHYNLIFSLKK